MIDRGPGPERRPPTPYPCHVCEGHGGWDRWSGRGRHQEGRQDTDWVRCSCCLGDTRCNLDHECGTFRTAD